MYSCGNYSILKRGGREAHGVTGAKAQFIMWLTARLKSCPDTVQGLKAKPERQSIGLIDIVIR
jgi:hypothetical protein